MIYPTAKLPIDVVAAEQEAARVEANVIRRVFARPPELDHLEWAERYRRLAKETTREGPWRREMVPYLVGPLNALSDPRVREVSIMKSAQSGATEGALINWVFRNIDMDPGPMLLLFPTEAEAQKFSKKKLAPALRATPKVDEKVAERGLGNGKKADGSTMLEKVYPGGSLGIIGGASSRGFRMVTIRYYGGDDIDGLDDEVTEGDQIGLLRKRGLAVWNAQGLWISSPGDEGSSKIEKLYGEMERRGRYHVPCPHCGHMQVLRWGEPDAAYGFKWDRDKLGNHLPDTVMYECESCHVMIDESEKYEMALRGDYMAADGEPVLSKPARTYGFWYNAFIVTWVSWADIVREFLAVKDDPPKLKVLVNTIFGETWRDPKAVKIDPGTLEDRAEVWEAEVPTGVGLLTAAVDVQQSGWLELLVVGWGVGEESWRIYTERIEGDPEKHHVWDQLTHHLFRGFKTAAGRVLHIQRTLVDAGALTKHVYGFVSKHEGANVWAAKGSDSRISELFKRAKTRNAAHVRPITWNTIAVKDVLFHRLKLLEPGPGFLHFNKHPERGFDAEYYAQLGAEEAHWKVVNGRRVRGYRQKRDRNEAIDLEGMNMIALQTLGRQIREQLPQMVETAKEPPAKATDAPAKRQAPARRSNWVYGWK